MSAEPFNVTVTRSTLDSVAPGRTRMTLDDTLEFSGDGVDTALRFSAIRSCRVDGERVILELVSPDARIELTADDAALVVRRIAARVCVLPELTLGMRSLGTRRAGPAREHDLFFGPLLRARATAERASSMRDRVRAFDVRALTTMVDETITSLAVERQPKSDPHRRALEAQLREYAEGLITRLGTLDSAAAPLARTPPDDAVDAWCTWATALRAVFEESDRFWEHLRRHLDTPAIPVRARVSGAQPARGGGS